MFSAMADVNHKATTLLWKPWFMWECLQNQETALTVTGYLIIAFLPPACTGMFQRCYMCVPARPARLTKTCSVPPLR